MIEWDAANYALRSGLQAAMAAEALALIYLAGSERVLDIGCGDGRVTAGLASRLPQGSVVGVDASREMVAFAKEHANMPNVKFQVADAAELPFHNEFDLVVSINALHWVPDPDPPLRGIRAAMKATGVAQLRLVADGERKSLETVIEETRRDAKWAPYFNGFRDPYLHVTPEQYAAAAERNGLGVERMHVGTKAWDFRSRENFAASCRVTLVAWTQRLPEADKGAFINEVLDRYEKVEAERAGEENTFKFYQMDVTLAAK